MRIENQVEEKDLFQKDHSTTKEHGFLFQTAYQRNQPIGLHEHLSGHEECTPNAETLLQLDSCTNTLKQEANRF